MENKLNSLKDQVKKCLEEGKPLNTCTNEKTEVQENLMVFSIENNKNIPKLLFTIILKIECNLRFMISIV